MTTTKKTAAGNKQPAAASDSKQKANTAPLRRVGIIFAGGPAPAANAVISAAAISLLDEGCTVVGFNHGYQHLVSYDPYSNRLQLDRDYRELTPRDVTGIRNKRGILIGTSRTNPGKSISCPADLDDEEKTRALRNVYFALADLGIQALISIGGDDTLRTANLLYEYQCRRVPEDKRIRIVHLPKTIDNDYHGIDFTFGFFTAVDVLAKEMQNLRADAQATGSWFIAEVMGRKSGWLAYGVGLAGEANKIISTEDLPGRYLRKETIPDLPDGARTEVLDVDKLADRIVDLILKREEEDKPFGTVALAEGLSDYLPASYTKDVARDEFGHIALSKLHLGTFMAERVSQRYQERTGRKRKVTGIQLGYESRCAPPHAFDVMLGSQLGIGAYRALVEEGLDAHMVSVQGQLEIIYVPFQELVSPETLVTTVRYIEPNSDYHRLARFLEDRTERADD